MTRAVLCRDSNTNIHTVTSDTTTAPEKSPRPENYSSREEPQTRELQLQRRATDQRTTAPEKSTNQELQLQRNPQTRELQLQRRAHRPENYSSRETQPENIHKPENYSSREHLQTRELQLQRTSTDQRTTAPENIHRPENYSSREHPQTRELQLQRTSTDQRTTAPEKSTDQRTTAPEKSPQTRELQLQRTSTDPRMEALCELSGLDPFWDWNLTWYTEQPDLTQCFQQTVLVWSPCIYLWTCSPLYLLYLQLRAPGARLPLSSLCCVKTAVAAILLCCCLVELLYIYALKEEMHQSLVVLLGPLLHIISLVLAVCVIQVERLKGVSSSILLFFFWLLLVLCSIVPLKVAVEQIINQSVSSRVCVLQSLCPPESVSSRVCVLQSLCPPESVSFIVCVLCPLKSVSSKSVSSRVCVLCPPESVSFRVCVLQSLCLQSLSPSESVSCVLQSLFYVLQSLCPSESVSPESVSSRVCAFRVCVLQSLCPPESVSSRVCSVSSRVCVLQSLCSVSSRVCVLQSLCPPESVFCVLQSLCPQICSDLFCVLQVCVLQSLCPPESVSPESVFCVLKVCVLKSLCLQSLCSCVLQSLCPPESVSFRVCLLCPSESVSSRVCVLFSPELLLRPLRFTVIFLVALLQVLQLLLTCFSDQPSHISSKSRPALVGETHLFTWHAKESARRCPEEGASFLSQFFFFWFSSLVLKGCRSPLQALDLWTLRHQDTSTHIMEEVEQSWAEGRRDKSLLLGFMRDPSSPLWKGLLYAVLLFLLSCVQSLLFHQYMYHCFTVGMRLKTALTGLLYRKCLVMSSGARRQCAAGEVISLVSADVQKLMDLVVYINSIWTAPLEIALSFYFLWLLLGPSALAGVSVVLLLFPLNGFITSEVQLGFMDGRIKLMTEMVSGMKILKFYAWEEVFQRRVQALRDGELAALKKSQILYCVSLASFASLVLSGHADSVRSLRCDRRQERPRCSEDLCVCRSHKHLKNSSEPAPVCHQHSGSDQFLQFAHAQFGSIVRNQVMVFTWNNIWRVVSLRRLTSFLQQDQVKEDSVQRLAFSSESEKEQQLLSCDLSSASIQPLLDFAPEDPGKLTEMDRPHTGRVRLQTYKEYFQTIGLLFLLLIVGLYGFQQGASLSYNYWLSVWADDAPVNGTQTDQALRLGVFAALGSLRSEHTCHTVESL
ncbi:hypothetical protein WMY93_005581 [Mugilogobius chulae]|uniref:ABC transmembrane type-1 domain-containing protein n=1 Tax=Mugilogobius chulae TaxID=88201 RepID=A0AAW0PTI5_9GOBI